MVERQSKITAASGFYIYIALCILLLPLRWSFAWLFAAAMHECGHMIAIWLCGGKIRGIQLKFEGAVIAAEFINKRTEAVCAVAGPLVSGLLLCAIGKFPLLGLFGFVQMAYNLLPFYPMDGGRFAKCILEELFSENTNRILLKIMTAFSAAGVLLLGMILTLKMHLGWLPLIFCVLLLIRIAIANIPCKPNRLIVQ